MSPSSRARLAAALLVVALAGSAACTRQAVSYQPRATIGASPRTLPLRIELRELEDASPPDDREPPRRGVAATQSTVLTGSLSATVTDALLDNLRSDAVFRRISRESPDADLVLTGTIRRFYGKAGANALGWLAWVWFLEPTGTLLSLVQLGAPIYSLYGSVDLELRFERPATGAVVRRFTASREFARRVSSVGEAETSIGPDLNRAFSAALADFREQLLSEREPLQSGSTPRP